MNRNEFKGLLLVFSQKVDQLLGFLRRPCVIQDGICKALIDVSKASSVMH